jgi:hypothetical protein
MAKTIMNSFVKQFIAELKGDDAEALAEKVWRQANSALKSSISSMEGDLIEKEDDVTNAEERLAKARINYCDSISDRNDYISRLISAKESLTKAQKLLNAHITTIEFLKGEWDSLKKEEK